MKYLSALLVVLAVFTLGTTTLATTATAGEIYAPRSWDTGDGGIVSYGDPDGGTGGNIMDRFGLSYTYGVIVVNPFGVMHSRFTTPKQYRNSKTVGTFRLNYKWTR